jgi:RND family efflux transporter MFP subunit
MSVKPTRSFLWLKVALAIGLLAALAVGVIMYLRPTAVVEAVISGMAIDAKPGSVAVQEEYKMDMKSEVAGRVLKDGYKLKVGNRVKEGDVLAHLDTADVQIEITQAQNNYNSAKQRAELPPAVTYQIDTARSEFTNTERLFKMGQVSESDYNKARRAVQTLETQLALEKVLNEENLHTDESALETKKRELEKMTITAPFDGVVSEVYAHPGDLISAGSPIMTLITTSRLVLGKISEEDFAKIKPGQKALVIFLPYGEFEYNGIVKEIRPTADPDTQRHLVELTITDIEPEKLIPGITGEVTIVVDSHQAEAIIPRRALFNQSVYVVKNGVIELRHVKTGFLWLRGAEITEGLKPGDLVVVEDLETFRDGERVRTEELPADVLVTKK